MESSLFFTQAFSADLVWRTTHHLRLGSVLPKNKKQISDSLRDLSRESIRNRFLGSKKEFSQKELEYLTTLDGQNHYALGLEEKKGISRGIAIARLVRSSSDPIEAEIAITIIDDYQGMGLGTFLMRLIILAGLERKIEKFSFTFLPQNDAIVRLIHKIGSPYQASSQMDYVQYIVEAKTIKVKDLKSQLRPHLPVIETFRLKT